MTCNEEGLSRGGFRNRGSLWKIHLCLWIHPECQVSAIVTAAVTLGKTTLPFRTSEPVSAQQCGIHTL